MKKPEIYVFGSVARGEVDPHSDVDILVVVGATQSAGFPVEWSVYTRRRLRSLYRRGTLFAWHLYKEAIPVDVPGSRGFLKGLRRPSPYASAREEVHSLGKVMRSAIAELVAGSPSPTYELGLVGMASRDISMAAWPVLRGRFVFSRLSPLLLGRPRFPLSKRDYDFLCDCRRSSTRGITSPVLGCDVGPLVQRLPKLHRWAMMIEERLK